MFIIASKILNVISQVVENSLFATQQPQPLKRHVIETLIIVSMTVVISMATDCLGIVLQVNVCMSFIVFYIIVLESSYPDIIGGLCLH